jgi:hypothetical protein
VALERSLAVERAAGEVENMRDAGKFGALDNGRERHRLANHDARERSAVAVLMRQVAVQPGAALLERDRRAKGNTIR